MNRLTINVAEKFDHLPHAPITEAIIQVRGRVLAPWEENSTLTRLKSALPDYPNRESVRTIQQDLTLSPDAQPETTPVIDLGWSGAVFRNNARTHVANFHRDAFSFSRLAPYETWGQFSAEALRLYQIHLDYSQLTQAQRIGLRFVNEFDAPVDSFNIADFFTQPLPVAHTELPLPRALFFHRDTFIVPDYPYGITVTRTLQPASPAPKLILDIDVFTSEPFSAEPAQVRARLDEMRWLKNKIFFGSLTPTALASFR
jgi:uncharacterized protein (TIGR04255 family)